ncbi:7693_t:CDS:2 [Ambispora leptoticha]|uniref:7693_t:CDS:1 n=1 Tax=Ambispora leptoticha TaxID=144679 RepID=A0A9N8WNT8_9GLOM|nr:7693_t:CDS:2 [Ambispora leptoticha]
MDQTNSSIGSSSESTEIHKKTLFSMSFQSAGVKRLEKSGTFVSEKIKKRRVNVDIRNDELEHQEQISKRHVCAAAVKYAPTTARGIISVRSLTGTVFPTLFSPHIYSSQETSTLVIPPLSIPDWHERIRILAAQRQNKSNQEKQPEVNQPESTQSTVSYGLSLINGKKDIRVEDEEDVLDLEEKANHVEIKLSPPPPQDEDQKLRQLALNELMKAPDFEDLTEDSQNILVLPQKENNYTQETKVNADDAESFRRLIKDHPDEDKIDYGRVPIQEFGAALLRGMGWKPGMNIGKNQSNKAVKLYEPQHRPALLGLGASVLPTSKTQERRLEIQVLKKSNKQTHEVPVTIIPPTKNPEVQQARNQNQVDLDDIEIDVEVAAVIEQVLAAIANQNQVDLGDIEVTAVIEQVLAAIAVVITSWFRVLNVYVVIMVESANRASMASEASHEHTAVFVYFGTSNRVVKCSNSGAEPRSSNRMASRSLRMSLAEKQGIMFVLQPQ